MANPIAVTCLADVWVKIATNVTTGVVEKLSKRPNLYLGTYKLTGEAAPTGKSLGTPLFINGVEQISASDPIDVYVMAVNVNGKVKVSL